MGKYYQIKIMGCLASKSRPWCSSHSKMWMPGQTWRPGMPLKMKNGIPIGPEPTQREFFERLSKDQQMRYYPSRSKNTEIRPSRSRWQSTRTQTAPIRVLISIPEDGHSSASRRLVRSASTLEMFRELATQERETRTRAHSARNLPVQSGDRESL